MDINHDVTDHDNHDHDDVYLRHEAPGGGHTFPDECLQLGALTDGGIVKQSRADLRHHVLQSTMTITERRKAGESCSPRRCRTCCSCRDTGQGRSPRSSAAPPRAHWGYCCQEPDNVWMLRVSFYFPHSWTECHYHEVENLTGL